jgi:ADP-ribose pyrophosphatase YjhB (NUDIX family)
VDIPGSWHSDTGDHHRCGHSRRGQWSAANPGYKRPTYKDYWDIPGGYVEPGESPLGACRREIREELSIAPPIAGQPLVIDWAPADGEGDKILFITGLAAYRAGHTAYAEHGNEIRDGGGWDGDSV